MPTYLELFAGAGGLSRGLEAAGFVPVAHCEIDPRAQSVLRYHWPDVRLDGDVTRVNGADFTGVTVVSGGSPCQDLSVAGKRQGLDGARSGLFYEQVRIWKESAAPYLIWENVYGALNSNKGRDFAAVLSAIVGATIYAPEDGWRRSGVAAGSTAVAAWRVLDLQHFGPPQRRVRVFIVAARTGGVDPAEVLALGEGVCGHPSPREQSRKEAASGSRGSTQGGDGVAFDTYNQKLDNVDATLSSGESGRPVTLAFESTGGSWGVNAADTAPPIKIGTGLGIASPPAVVQCATSDVAHALTRRGDSSEDGTGRGTPIVAFSRGGFGAWSENEAVTALCARDGKDQSSIVLPALPASLQYSGTGHNKDELIIQQRKKWPKEIADTLTVAYANKQGLEDQHINSGAGLFQQLPTGRPRRLTPLECERLMSWPDKWTAIGINEDGTMYELSDTARYRLCGNGVGSVCVAWFAQRLMDAINAQGVT